jgi:hypothetical protein
VVATPNKLALPITEVGAISPPRTIQLTNESDAPVEVSTLEIRCYGPGAADALPGEFELLQGHPRVLGPREAMTVDVVFRPTRAIPHIGARLVAKGRHAEQIIYVSLRGAASEPRGEHSDQRELSIAEHDARLLEFTATPTVDNYSDMLAAVLAARNLTDRLPRTPRRRSA